MEYTPSLDLSRDEELTDNLWELENSVEVEVPLEFAWKYRTDITNWNDPPARFELNGPFVAGSRGTTILPDQPPLHWTISEVRPPQYFVIEMELDKALLAFEWRFKPLTEQMTRMTQRIVLRGENAPTYVDQVKAAFTTGLANGMNRIAAEMSAKKNRE